MRSRTNQDLFASVLGSLHDAALDDTQWPALSGRLDQLCGMKGSALGLGKGRSWDDAQIHFLTFCSYGQRDEDLERFYFDNYYRYDERVPRLTRLPDSRLVHITDLYTEKELKTSPAYNEALARGGYQNGLNVRLDGPDGCSIAWGLTDSIERDGWGSAQIQTVERLLPHIRQFVRVRQALAGAEALGVSLAALLAKSGIGIIQLDRGGRIVEVNDWGRNRLQRGSGLFDQEGFLRASLPADDAHLQRLLTSALPTFGGFSVSGSMALRRSAGLARLAVHITPVGDRKSNFGIGRVAVLVLVVEPGSQRVDIDPRVVADVLDLTPAESRVAVSLAAGNSVRDIAEETGRQENSVRFLLKSIYRKQHISRQADLVRLVLSLGRL